MVATWGGKMESDLLSEVYGSFYILGGVADVVCDNISFLFSFIKITEVIILISFMDRSALFCNSIDLLDNLENPTPFCKLSGRVNV